MKVPRERAVVFIDGNNWYHALKNAGFNRLGWLNYAKVSQKIIGTRDWIGTRYYIGQVQQAGNTQLYADQRKYTAWLKSLDQRISVRFGRLEPRPVENEFAREMLSYLGNLPVRIDTNVYKHLIAAAKRNECTTVMVEKAVDVMLAVDMVRMADRNDYDVAYLLAADGDYTPAVAAATDAGKKVFAVSINAGAALAAVAYKYIRLQRDWFTDCFG